MFHLVSIRISLSYTKQDTSDSKGIRVVGEKRERIDIQGEKKFEWKREDEQFFLVDEPATLSLGERGQWKLRLCCVVESDENEIKM